MWTEIDRSYKMQGKLVEKHFWFRGEFSIYKHERQFVLIKKTPDGSARIGEFDSLTIAQKEAEKLS